MPGGFFYLFGACFCIAVITIFVYVTDIIFVTKLS